MSPEPASGGLSAERAALLVAEEIRDLLKQHLPTHEGLFNADVSIRLVGTVTGFTIPPERPATAYLVELLVPNKSKICRVLCPFEGELELLTCRGPARTFRRVEVRLCVEEAMRRIKEPGVLWTSRNEPAKRVGH